MGIESFMKKMIKNDNDHDFIHYRLDEIDKLTSLRAERRRREARREKCTHENCTPPTIHLGPAGRRPALGLVLSNSCIETQIYVVSFLLFLDISQEEDYSLPPVYNYHQITMDCFKI